MSKRVVDRCFRENWPHYFRELYEERASIMEFLGNMERPTAEACAQLEVARMAKADGVEGGRLCKSLDAIKKAR